MQTLRSWFPMRGSVPSSLLELRRAGRRLASVVWRPMVLVLTFCIFHSSFCIAPCAAAPQTAESDAEAALAKITAGVERFTLPNGLIGLAREDTGADAVSIQVWVGAGSAHEQEYLGGGISHLIEHMVFKGTPKQPPGEIARAINATGGSINAYTSLDRTVFLADLPAAHWRTGLEVLSDAVLNASFPEDEWRREKDVVRREMAMCHDSPERRVSELLCETAYRVHPYRFPVIGYEDIFNGLTRADLIAFHRRHYVPNNMIVSIVGNVPLAEIRAEVKKQFAGYPRRAYAQVMLNTEPEQIATRTARETGDWTLARLAWAWHTVPLSHPDAPALDLLAVIAGQGRSSRLALEIKENRKLVSEINAWSFTPRECGLFGVSAVFDPTNEPALTLALEGEIRRLADTPFKEQELEQARRQLLTGTLSAFQTMHGQADQLASGEFYAGTPLFCRVYLQRLSAVTPAALNEVARGYLTPENLTKSTLSVERRAWSVGETNSGGSTLSVERRASEARGAESVRSTWSGEREAGSVGTETNKAGSALSVKRRAETLHASRHTLSVLKALYAQRSSGGLPLLTRPDHRLPFVDFTIACGGGLLFENEGNNGISLLMAEMMTRGTKKRSAQDIARLVESRGGSLSAFAGLNSFGLQARCLKADAQDFMELLADCLLNPAFDDDETAKQKMVQLSAIRQQREAPMFLAQEALRQALFPGHPYRFSPEGSASSVDQLTKEALQNYHARTVVNGNMVAAIFGDITTGDAQALATRFLDQLKTGPRPALEHKAGKPSLPRQVELTAPKEQTVILAGFPGIDVRDPRRDALDILQKAMNGLSSDLMTMIRDKQGLVYYAGLMQRPGLEPGYLAFYAGTHTGAVERVQELIQAEARRVASTGLRPEEFERARAQLVAEHQQSLQVSGELALECALNELYALGCNYGFTLEQRLQAVTPEDVRKAAASLLAPEKCVNVVVQPGP